MSGVLFSSSLGASQPGSLEPKDTDWHRYGGKEWIKEAVEKGTWESIQLTDTYYSGERKEFWIPTAVCRVVQGNPWPFLGYRHTKHQAQAQGGCGYAATRPTPIHFHSSPKIDGYGAIGTSSRGLVEQGRGFRRTGRMSPVVWATLLGQVEQVDI